MNFFETVKHAVTAKQAAAAYGLEVDKHGIALCPFHEDHHPSLKLDERYYCFGCHATGDVIDFTARLFGISPKSAARKLARDFGIDPRPPTQSDIPILNAELHDRSFGFFRRQIILEAKERNPSRKDDPYLAERLCAEKEGIFLWALAGLQRLIRNGFQFTLSDRAKANMEAAVADGNNIVEFMQSEGYFQFKADSEVSSRDFYEVYRLWCEDNALNPLAQKTLTNYLKLNESLYNLEYTNKVHIGGGRYARGFLGIELLQRPGW